MNHWQDIEQAVSLARKRDLLALEFAITTWETKRIIAQLFVDDWNARNYGRNLTKSQSDYHNYLVSRCDILISELDARGVTNPFTADHFSTGL